MKRSLYFFFNRYTGLIKVGIAESVPHRRRQIEHASGVRLEILGTVDGAEDLEQELHAALFDSREVGEWFQPTEALVALAVAPTRENIQALIRVRAPDMREFQRAKQQAKGEEATALEAERAEARRIERELAAAQKAAKEKRIAREKERAAKRDLASAEAHRERMKEWSERDVSYLKTHNLERKTPTISLEEVEQRRQRQRERNQQFTGVLPGVSVLEEVAT